MGTSYSYEGIIYGEGKGVYPVERDSLFMLEILNREIEGTSTLIDMGCGAGLATLLASSKGIQTISIDREPLALSALRRNLEANRLYSTLFLSDLFDGVPRSYLGWADMICFNPPYLPNTDHFLDRRPDLPLNGGRKGWETASGFLSESARFLSARGKVLLLCYEDWKMKDLDPDGIFAGRGVVKYRKEIDGEKFQIMILYGAKKNIANCK
jgi:methylase of polypeptide subunit release factors